MRHDPAGHYATLGIDPAAPAEAITAAFRAAVRRVHPDVLATGDPAAFMRIRAAYEVLGNRERRAAYDEAAWDAEARDAEARADADAAELGDAPPEPAAGFAEVPAAAWQRQAGLPLGLWAGAAGVALLALTLGFVGLGPPRPQPPPAAFAPAPPAAPPPRAPQTPATAQVEGVPSGYILPAGGPATLWRRGPAGDRFVPAGELPAFTPVALRRIVSQHGMVEVGTPDGRAGFVYADRVAPGDAAEAERARCIFEAGAPPANNEILARHGSGPAQVFVKNRRDQPAVVKLRDAAGASAATVFIAPGGAAAVDGLPAGVYRPEFAFGELWSRACGRFVAGMRAQHFASFGRLGETGSAASRYTIPPEDGVDETDETFDRD